MSEKLENTILELKKANIDLQNDVEKLNETDRKMLLAFSLEGRPTKEIAEEMKMSDGQVRVRLHRIRRKLKKGMSHDA